MSALNYRSWDTFVNQRLAEAKVECHGHYEIDLVAFMMTDQTIEFIEQHFSLQLPHPVRIDNSASLSGVIRQWRSPEPKLKIRGTFSPHLPIQIQINAVLDYLTALSICVDHPLAARIIRFEDDHEGIVLEAARRPFARGVAFELDERGIAHDKTQHDFTWLVEAASKPGVILVATRHYLCGMGMLAMEDSLPGLIDAAYMQFYQGIEALTETHELEKAKKAISAADLPNSRDLQIACHQVFSVRHKYFGHGNETSFHEIADRGMLEATRIARQVLVARWLCKALLDARSPSRLFLAREMRIYGPQGSTEFRGQASELEEEFWVDFGQNSAAKANCRTYGKTGAASETYTFLPAPAGA